MSGKVLFHLRAGNVL